jgi:hypothetical protein
MQEETPNVETVEEANVVSETQDQPQAESQEEKNVLLGAISYSNDEDYDNFLMKMDINQALFVLIASANYGQAKGLYNLDESELIARAIKTIKKNTAAPETESGEPQA